MTGPLSDQQLDEIRRRDILKGRGESATTMTQAQTDRRVLLAELERLRGERDHLVSAFDKLGDQMGELVQAARSERDRLTAEAGQLRGELDDAAGYLAVTHRHAGRHDVLGADLGCAGCALLDRIEDGPQRDGEGPPAPGPDTQPRQDGSTAQKPAVGTAGDGSEP